MSDDRTSFLRAVAKNALLFGTLCGTGFGALVTLWVLFVPGPGVESLPERVGGALLAGVSMGVRFALAGAAIGTFFALAVRFAFRGRRLSDLSIWKFALLGAVVGGVGIPLFYQALNVLSDGHMIAWNLVTDDSIWASIFGAGAAAGSIFLVRRAAALPREKTDDELRSPDALSGLPAGKQEEQQR